MECVGTEQILYCLIVATVVCSSHHAEVYLLVLVNLVIERRGERDGEVVTMLCLEVVHSVLACKVGVLVGIVEAVPVDLAVSLRSLPVVVCILPVGESLICTVSLVVLIPHIEVAAGQILPVVRLRVVRVVIVELRALIHRVASEH